jgi:plasmid maintenance system antidote protein VapI
MTGKIFPIHPGGVAGRILKPWGMSQNQVANLRCEPQPGKRVIRRRRGITGDTAYDLLGMQHNPRVLAESAGALRSGDCKR